MSGRVVRRLQNSDIIKLNDYLRASRKELEGKSGQQIAEIASKAVGVSVPESTVRGLCKDLGFKLTVVRTTQSRIAPDLADVLKQMATASLSVEQAMKAISIIDENTK